MGNGLSGNAPEWEAPKRERARLSGDAHRMALLHGCCDESTAVAISAAGVYVSERGSERVGGCVNEWSE